MQPYSVHNDNQSKNYRYLIHINCISFEIDNDAKMTSVFVNEENLIRQYVAICNEALIENAHRFPFRQIMDAAEKSERGKRVEARIIDSPYKNSFILTLKEKRIDMQPHSVCRDCNCDYIWNISMCYLEDVIGHPDQYISNPARLDWDWLYHKS